MLPQNAYLICATPRSGSTLLCQLLMDSGVAGRPSEYFEYLRHSGRPIQPWEFFNPQEMQREDYREIMTLLCASQKPRVDKVRLRRWADVGYSSELRTILATGTTANGIFGAKMMWGYLHNFLQLVKTDSSCAPVDSHPVLSELFPKLRYIRIRRIDKLRQAISLWKAIQTQQWRRDEGTEMSIGIQTHPVFHFEAIRCLRAILLRHSRLGGNSLCEVTWCEVTCDH